MDRQEIYRRKHELDQSTCILLSRVAHMEDRLDLLDLEALRLHQDTLATVKQLQNSDGDDGLQNP